MTHQAAAKSAERAFLGSLLIDRDAIASVADAIRPSAFLIEWHRWLFEAILALWSRREPPDPVTVHDEVTRAHPEVDLAFVTGLLIDAPVAVHAPYYASLVVQHARSRAVAEIGAQLAREARSAPEMDAGEYLRQALDRIPDFGSPAEETVKTYADLMPDFISTITAIQEGKVTQRAARTTIARLDAMLTGGFKPGELAILGARPGMGKTAIALQFAHNVARAGQSVVIFSAEMSARQLLYRAASEVSMIPSALILAGSQTRDQFDKYLRGADVAADLPIAIDDTPGISIDQMIARTQRFQEKQRVDLVIFDYLELAGSPTRHASEEQRVSDIARGLKLLARQTDTPVLGLSQLSRQVENRPDKRPSLADLRYSGAIEAAADVVMFLYREGYYAKMGTIKNPEREPSETEVIVAKNRHGATGVVSLRFDEHTMTFREWYQ